MPWVAAGKPNDRLRRVGNVVTMWKQHSLPLRRSWPTGLLSDAELANKVGRSDQGLQNSFPTVICKKKKVLFFFHSGYTLMILVDWTTNTQ